MADYAADAGGNTTNGGVLTPRTGTASGDTVPAGARIIARNTGAGSLTITLTNALTQDGLTVANKTHTLTAGQARSFRVNPAWADANGRVPMAVTSGTAGDLTYWVSD
jgi:hypothetical protein